MRQQIEWVHPSGKPIGAVGEPLANLADGSLSPDGHTLAITRVQNGEQFIWLMDISRGTLSRFSQGGAPVWAPDGARIAFFTEAGTGSAGFTGSASGRTTPQEFCCTGRTEGPKHSGLVARRPAHHVLSQSPTNARDLWMLPTTGAEQTPTPYVQTPAEETQGAFSPDGKWFVYLSDGDGPLSRPRPIVPGSGRDWRVSPGDGRVPFWRADGRAIFYLAPAGLTAVGFAGAGGTPQLGTPTVIVPRKSTFFDRSILLRARTDGQRFLLAMPTDDAPAEAPLTIIVNWTGGAK